MAKMGALLIFLSRGAGEESTGPSSDTPVAASAFGIRIDLVKRLVRRPRPLPSEESRERNYQLAETVKDSRRRALVESADLELTDYFNNQCVSRIFYVIAKLRVNAPYPRDPLIRVTFCSGQVRWSAKRGHAAAKHDGGV
jgi:hypothetical protein